MLSLWRPVSAPAAHKPELLGRVDPLLALFLRKAWAHLSRDSYEGVRRDLIASLLVKLILRAFPMSPPSASDGQYVATGDYDRITGPRLAHYFRGRASGAPRALLRMADQLNGAITPGRASVAKLDVFEFLKSIDADAVYLDAPCGATQAYERAFRLIDEFLGIDPLPTSDFSSQHPPLDELLDSCAHIPIVVFSMSNKLHSEEQLAELVARHRTVRRVASVPYRHHGSIASSSANANRREILILSTTSERAGAK